ncbi:hypothetical protein SERLA73DRAFT_52842 [Serpula lacrymans var. lacrymans S7.3]|uniref:Uncharacterized protein n=1 Tax=Serpula lacrymans var. lacrymans (strain S7.3) TaxID=936435 RepID=F8PVS7_SERL3|nr:hypothetical protein SERLA73DRAFT_52842 [Serpula lacrymans var. lacrymans S7.3]
MELPTDAPAIHQTLPDISANCLYNSWKALIPMLITLQLNYFAKTLGKPLVTTCDTILLCVHPDCVWKQTSLVCLFFHHMCLLFLSWFLLIYFQVFPTSIS